MSLVWIGILWPWTDFQCLPATSQAEQSQGIIQSPREKAAFGYHQITKLSLHSIQFSFCSIGGSLRDLIPQFSSCVKFMSEFRTLHKIGPD
jgi:hypothetical protein